MAKRALIVLVVVLLLLALMPGLGVAMAMEPCLLCDGSTRPMMTICFAVLAAVGVLLAAGLGRSIEPLPITRRLGPPGPRLFHPPRSY